MNTTIDKPLLQRVRRDLDAAMETIGAKYGLLIKCGAGRFTETTADMKVGIAVAGGAGEGAESPREVKARQAWAKYAVGYGFKPEWLGASFSNYAGERFIVLGLQPTRPKYPVMTRSLHTSKTVLHMAETLVGAMAREVNKPSVKPIKRTPNLTPAELATAAKLNKVIAKRAGARR